MKLAAAHQIPIWQAMNEYPADEIPYWTVWYEKERLPHERIEYSLSQIGSVFAQLAGNKKGHPASKPDFYVYPSQWKTERIASDIQSINEAFSGAHLKHEN